jgi:hypothetical protein
VAKREPPDVKTPDVRALAQRHTRKALATLAEIMERGASEQARIAAADKLLDRAHGRVRAEGEAGSSGKSLEQLLRGDDDASQA